MSYVLPGCRYSCAALLLSGSGALAETADGSRLSVTVSTPAYYSSNAGFTRNNPIDTIATSPAASVDYARKITTALTFNLGSAAIVERHSNPAFGFDTLLAYAGFSYAVAGWTYDIVYKPRWLFAPGLSPMQVRFDDVTALATAPNVNLGAAGTLSYQLGYRERLATIATLSSHQPFGIVSWSKNLDVDNRTWTVGLDATFAFPNLYRSAPDTRNAIVSPAASLATRLSDNVGLKFSASYMNLWSTDSVRQADGVSFGAALVFKTDIF